MAEYEDLCQIKRNPAVCGLLLKRIFDLWLSREDDRWTVAC